MEVIGLFQLAQRYIGVNDIPGMINNDTVLKMLQLDNPSITNDETPWCSAFVNYIAWTLRLPRTKTLLARHWLKIGKTINLAEAQAGYDVIIIKRGDGIQPGSENTSTIGHVGFYAGHDETSLYILGGNQENKQGVDEVSIKTYPRGKLLGIKRLI